MSDENDDAVQFLLKTLETQGAAVSTVKDGHIVLFTRKMLQEMMDKNPDQEKFIIFLKQPGFEN
jgi:hypothetical protein